MKMEVNSYCHSCGTAYETVVWPRTCYHCGLMEWRRINPVAVLIQPVIQSGRWNNSILIGKRNIHPGFGLYGLPGGHIEYGEMPEDAAVRELHEEMGFVISRDDIKYHHSYTDDKGHMLLFFLGKPIHAIKLGSFVPSDECSEMKLATEPMELAFKSHTEALMDFFETS